MTEKTLKAAQEIKAGLDSARDRKDKLTEFEHLCEEADFRIFELKAERAGYTMQTISVSKDCALAAVRNEIRIVNATIIQLEKNFKEL